MTSNPTIHRPGEPDDRDRPATAARTPADREPAMGSISGAANTVGRTAGAWAAQLNSTVRTLPRRYRVLTLAGVTLVGVTLTVVTATAIRGGTRASSWNGPSS